MSYFWRASIQETLVTEFTGQRGLVALELLKTNIKLLLLCVLTVAAKAIFLSMFIVFLPTFCQNGLGFDKVTTSVYVLVTIVTYAISALAGGYLGDNYTYPLAISLLAKSAVASLFIVLFVIVNGLLNANYMIVVLNRLINYKNLVA